MLSRTASNLYWMARYLERAESTARLLGACFQPGIPVGSDLNNLYLLPLKIQSAADDFYKHRKNNLPLSIAEVSQFLISGESMASVGKCLENARENARAERSRISSDVWEAVNQTWLEYNDHKNLPLHSFTEWLQQRAFTFHGAVAVTMPESLSCHFLRIGAYIERADQTLRVLEAKNELEVISHHSDYYNWLMLLRAVSSFEAYQETFTEIPSVERVFKFLLFNKYIPRSLRYCIERIQIYLEQIKAGRRLPALKLCGQLAVKLKYDEPADIVNYGADKYIQNLQDEVSALDLAIQDGFFITK